MNEELKQRIIKSLGLMIKDRQWREDQTKLNFEPNSQGGYSPDLTEAIAVLAELKCETERED